MPMKRHPSSHGISFFNSKLLFWLIVLILFVGSGIFSGLTLN